MNNRDQQEDARVGLIRNIWSYYFPRQPFYPKDSRLAAVKAMYDFLRSRAGEQLLEPLLNKRSLKEFHRLSQSSSELEASLQNSGEEKSLFLDVVKLSEELPFRDFVMSLRLRPDEVTGTLGIACSILLYEDKCRNLNDNRVKKLPSLPVIVRPRFFNFPSCDPNDANENNDDIDISGEDGGCSFSELRAGRVGQMVSVTGHVVKIGNCRPLIERAQFYCNKCQSVQWTHFEDGIYTAPSVCTTEKCGNKFLEFLRSSAVMTDYQRIKLQEQDSNNAGSRIPRTFEVEVRGSLVNLCITGDLLTVVGIVKTIQLDVFKARRKGEGFGGGRGVGGAVGKESGLHQLYLLANSLLCCHGSGDRAGEQKGPSDSVLPTDHSDPAAATAMQALNPIIFNSESFRSGGEQFSPSELQWIRTFAYQDRLCFPLLVRNFCPAICGHELVKAGLLLGLFGGTKMNADGSEHDSSSNYPDSETADGFKIRADIHILVVGDPGLGKSQMLRAAAAIAPRSVSVCGNTSTTAGLTVTVGRDGSGGSGGDVSLEAGALVLADKGVCCIDELDKISCDQHALLEAMEQQRISVAKSGVATSLKSRTTVLAAANPAGGHYNRRKSVCENLKMNSALLSRFDLIFILLDRPDENRDKLIGEHILRTTASFSASATVSSSSELLAKRRNIGDDSVAIVSETLSQRLRRQLNQLSSSSSSSSSISTHDIPENMFRRYVEYARTYVHPKLSKSAAKVLQRQYLAMRSQSYLTQPSGAGGSKGGGSIPVTTRNLESLIRLSQARAKMELRDYVTEDDANDVVQLLQESLLDAYTDELGQIDAGRRGGISLAKQIKCLVRALTHEAGLRGSTMFSKTEIQESMLRARISADVESIIDVMRTECYLLLKGKQLYQLQTA